VREDRLHLKLLCSDLDKWTSLIEKKQERAFLDNIRQSVYDTAFLRQISEKRGGPAEVREVLETLGLGDDALSDVLGRPGKANVPISIYFYHL
jgi:hypothetical protein